MSGKILIVDDVATNRIVYKVKLGAACYVPILASDGATCLALAMSDKPDLILLDLVLPDMGGADVLRRLRANPETAAIPVVVFSAETGDDARLDALAAGADDFLTKSVDDQTLMARLRNLLRGQEALAELEGGAAPIRALGFAEPATAFCPPGAIALVSQRPETALKWRRDLGQHLHDKMTVLSRETALSDAALNATPDVFVIESNLADPMGGLRLMSELRSHTRTRHAAICIVRCGTQKDEAAMAFDLGANDVIDAHVSVQEFSLRITRLLQRKREGDRLRASVRTGLRMAVTDPLTGLFNRRYAISQLSEIAAHARMTGKSFAVMVLDLDRFKDVNDRYGHPAGDFVLTEVARRMSAKMRVGDLLARIGGEEFLIALPDTDLVHAGKIAERLCQAVKEMPFRIQGAAPLDVTASIGLAICDGGTDWVEDSIADVIDRADQALLIAKSKGRNRVTISRSAA